MDLKVANKCEDDESADCSEQIPFFAQFSLFKRILKCFLEVYKDQAVKYDDSPYNRLLSVNKDAVCYIL